MAGAVDELLKKREELSERRQALAQEVARIDKDVAAVEHVLRLLDPSVVPTSPRRRRSSSADDPFAGANLTARVLMTLRAAKEPISTAACASAIAQDKGLAEGDLAIGRMSSRISALLASLEGRGRVRRAGTVDGRKNLWEIAR
jgi:hypothetical protein